HGYQSTEPALRRVPMAYFHPSGPIGDVFAEISVRDPKTPVAIIGLGTGAMAAYAAPGQLMQFYEIDPMIYRIAGTPAYFSYLEDCLGDCRVALGDGRLNLAKAGDRSFGAIILDAFSSDSIPTHLVTREAIRLYLRKLDEGGVIAFHITNRYLDMVQLLGNLAEDSGLVAYTRKDFKVSRDEFREGKAGSQYVVMARSKKDLGDIAANPQWKPISPKEMPVVWTDRFSNILSVIKW
ncbi:MAG: spermidine synthase, partial [Gammaproteobacteria bacterium]